MAVVSAALGLLDGGGSITEGVPTDNTLALKDLDNAYLIADHGKFGLGVEFNDDLLGADLSEVISSKIESVRRFSFGFIDATSSIAERYLLIYISSIANTNTKRRCRLLSLL